MVNKYGDTLEKVTFSMPAELKEQVMVLKDELHMSLSAIYNDAITRYVRQKELERWQNGVSQALKDKEYEALSGSLGSDKGDLYEY